VKGEEIVRISSGKLYLIEERVPLRTHQLLRKELARGRAALYISKHSPSQLGTQFSLDSDPLQTKWLTPRPESSCIPPMNLVKFEENVKEFLKQNHDGIVVLNGVDVLEMWNGSRPVLEVIKKVQKEMNASEANFIISLDPKNHYQTSLHALEKASDEVVYPTV
jgi:Protein of unknown function (DUF835)